MCNINNLVFEPFTETDIDALTKIMERAFDEDTRIHLHEDKGGPDGYDNGDFLRKWGLNSPTKHYKILGDGELIGGVILWINENHNNYLGTIFIDPAIQNKGIGTRLWKQIESMYPETKKWSTETPGFSKRNHNFYINKCGFNVVKIENPGIIKEESYLLERSMI